jgi:hypothetical protein
MGNFPYLETSFFWIANTKGEGRTFVGSALKQTKESSREGPNVDKGQSTLTHDCVVKQMER